MVNIPFYSFPLHVHPMQFQEFPTSEDSNYALKVSYFVIAIYTMIVPSSWLIFHLLTASILTSCSNLFWNASSRVSATKSLLDINQHFWTSYSPQVQSFIYATVQHDLNPTKCEVRTAHPCITWSSRDYVISLFFSLDLSQQGIIHFTTLSSQSIVIIITVIHHIMVGRVPSTAYMVQV